MSVKNPVEFNELYHHGVQGMKWGKRNGPPYPLNAKGKAKLAKQKKSSGRASGGSGDSESGTSTSKKAFINRISTQIKLKKDISKSPNIKHLYKLQKDDPEKFSKNPRNVSDMEAVPRMVEAAKNNGYEVDILTGPVAGFEFINQDQRVVIETENKDPSKALSAAKNIKSDYIWVYKDGRIEDMHTNKIVSKDYDKKILNKYPSVNQYDELKKLSRNKDPDFYKKMSEYTKHLSDSERIKYYEDFRPQDMSEKDFLKKIKSFDNAETGLFNQKQPKKQETPVKDYSKMSKEDISAQKEKVIRSGDIREAYKNRNFYTDDELKRVKARYTLNLEVQQLTEADKKKGAEQVQKIAKNMETIANLTKAVSNIAINVANVYSAASRISTAKKVMTENSKPAPKPQQPQQIGLFPPKQQQQVQQPVQQPPIQKPNSNKKKKKK